MPLTRKLTDDEMYARVLAGDAESNGRFFFGVTSTGIYCLPSCSARKPLRRNIRFFPSVEAARGAGLRACRKCRPDDFADGADPVLESIEALVAEVRTHPETFPDVRSLVRRSGFGPTRLFELFRLHYHVTPAELLLRARLEAARVRLVRNGDEAGLSAITAAAGFESLSVFHAHFHARNGMTPAIYRTLPGRASFSIALPAGYPLEFLRQALGRDRHSVTARLEGDVYTAALRLPGGPALLRMHLSGTAVRIECAEGRGPEAHAAAIRMLGLDQDAAAFARHAKRIGLNRLTAGRAGLRLTQSFNAFDGLLWAVLGQQINMPFACLLRRRLTEKTGEIIGEKVGGNIGKPPGDGLYAPPSPDAVAALEVSDLLPLQFSRQKAEYVIGIARLVAGGTLDLESLRGQSAARVARRLQAVRGLGPWSVNYVMMRALGFPDCVPYGDTGLTSGLQALLNLEERPDVAATRRHMALFAPWRSLATAHLWQYERRTGRNPSKTAESS